VTSICVAAPTELRVSVHETVIHVPSLEEKEGDLQNLSKNSRKENRENPIQAGAAVISRS
jgi:hypothetical protein